jgi:hypothetical protein
MRQYPAHGDVKTIVRSDGLRYESKAATTNSPFPGAPGSSMSCFVCGRHVVRSSLTSFLLAGRRQFRCVGGCKDPQGKT